MIRIGLVGKTNTGKTTFFNSATLLSAEVSTYPFTTKQPNLGQASVQTICVCKELNVKDNPQNSSCIDGWRFIPIEIIDLPGLIKGAWRGRGLGTQFLSVASQADALLHIADASGSIDANGNLTRPGMGNPISDIYDIEEEITLWFSRTMQKSKRKVMKQIKQSSLPMDLALAEVFAGLKVKHDHVKQALSFSNLTEKKIDKWSQAEFLDFAKNIRKLSKPTIIIANKMDVGSAEENFKRLREEFKDSIVIPVSSEAELALRRAEQKGFIKYIPGEEVFKVISPEKLTETQKRALNYVQQRVLSKWIRTGVQFALNLCAFKLLGMGAVYPVEDVKNLADKKGNILPDVFLMPPDSIIKELASQIHSDLARTILYAIDARTGVRLPIDYVLRDRDIINIVSATPKR
ncbi:MAG: redox-regulated ATPase YchF [Candidatus Hodarchaeota archaeon]